MIIIYCAQDKQKKVVDRYDLGDNYLFLSPNENAVNHTASKVIVVGPHPEIEQRYRGIVPVETITFDQEE